MPKRGGALDMKMGLYAVLAVVAVVVVVLVVGEIKKIFTIQIYVTFQKNVLQNQEKAKKA